MLPAFLSTVTIPSATIHFAGPLRSCAETHSSRFLPSKRMIASEGAAAQVAPGVTTLGSGVQTSVSSGLAVDGCWAKTADDRTIRKAAVRAWVRIALYRIHREVARASLQSKRRSKNVTCSAIDPNQ